jgi:hypothetical protein
VSDQCTQLPRASIHLLVLCLELRQETEKGLEVVQARGDPLSEGSLLLKDAQQQSSIFNFFLNDLKQLARVPDSPSLGVIQTINTTHLYRPNVIGNGSLGRLRPRLRNRNL